MNQSQPPGMGPLEKGDQVYPERREGPKDNCEEILRLIHCNGGLPVSLQPAQLKSAFPESEFREIRGISQFIRETRIPFNKYKELMDEILHCKLGALDTNKKLYKGACEDKPEAAAVNLPPVEKTLLTKEENTLFRHGALFSSSKAYGILKYATEKFVYSFMGFDPGDITNPPLEVLPYVALIEAKLGDLFVKKEIHFRPLFAELIWNYWHEEGMVSHTLRAIARRFQNKPSRRGPDRLANLDIDPLRPLNNLVWGYIQDTANRLTPERMAFEYEHEYGICPFAAGGEKLHTADSRSFFIEAFHSLLYKCSVFYKEADNLFKVPDAFPVLNALREVHLLLAEGAGNQFAELSAMARSEVLLEQYILSRPEIREFLGGRVMVPYDEAWMDRVDVMKSLQGWPGASISYFRDLAVYGEEIILSIRWISWSQVNNRDIAREWAIIFRNAIQRYIFCYQAVTGVDLSALEVAGGNSNEKAL
ncbi:MAG TPA: hypothetical protein VNU70_05500, partial [Puia sp.]|nr:hypothetical protein [Puia sp.]